MINRNDICIHITGENLMIRKLIIILMTIVMTLGFILVPYGGATPSASAAPAELTIGGLFPLTGTLSGGGVEREAAARLAIEQINADNTLLPDTVLKMLVRDTATDAVTGATAATELAGLDVFGFVGAASSTVSKAIATVAETNTIPQISYSSTNADLSDKTIYPYFLRVVPPDSIQGVVLANILDDIGITNVATLSSNDDYGSRGIAIFETAFASLGGTIATSQQFAQGASSVSSQLSAIVDSGAKIIVLNVIVGDAITIFSQTEAAGISGSAGYQWVGTDGPTQSQVFTDDLNVVDDGIKATMMGMFGTAPNRGSGALYEAFLDLWEAADPSNYAGAGDRSPNTFATFAYDAVYAFARAANNMITAGADPTDGTLLLAELQGLSFEGATGPVSFDENGDRLGVYDILNLQTNGFKVVGAWDASRGMILTDRIQTASSFDITGLNLAPSEWTETVTTTNTEPVTVTETLSITETIERTVTVTQSTDHTITETITESMITTSTGPSPLNFNMILPFFGLVVFIYFQKYSTKRKVE